MKGKQIRKTDSLQGGSIMKNPVWKHPGFEITARSTGSTPLAVRKVVDKALLCLVILVFSTIYMWTRHYAGKGIILPTLIGMGGGLAGFYVSYRIPELSVLTVPLFMILEGITVGGVSALVEIFYPGVLLNAVVLTYMAAMLILLMYRFEFLTGGNRLFRAFSLVAGSIILFYVLKFILSIFSAEILRFISPIGMGLCLLILVVGSINLISDMEFIKEKEELGIRKRAEWTAVLGVMVTVGWVYLEVARLINLSKDFIKNKMLHKKELPDSVGEKPSEAEKTDNNR